MNVKLKLTHPDARYPFKTYEKDFCYDVTAVSEEEVAPNVWKYGIGLAFQIERDQHFDFYCSSILSIDFRSRSSIWKTGMVLSNSTGTIDELFTGEVSAVFYHVMPNMPRYKIGDRIGQIKLGITVPLHFIQVSELKVTERETGAYGSTGR